MPTLGTIIPDSIATCISDMQEMLIDCRPFADAELEENINFIDVCVDRAEKILQLAQALKRINAEQAEEVQT